MAFAEKGRLGLSTDKEVARGFAAVDRAAEYDTELAVPEVGQRKVGVFCVGGQDVLPVDAVVDVADVQTVVVQEQH